MSVIKVLEQLDYIKWVIHKLTKYDGPMQLGGRCVQDEEEDFTVTDELKAHLEKLEKELRKIKRDIDILYERTKGCDSH
jgi:hypothetical protein